MARARLLKPGFFSNERLSDVAPIGRLLFAGLWTIADREGRMPDRPKWIKGALFPYENPPVERLLGQLATLGFIERYEVDGERYIQVTNFSKHQHVHVNEQPSTIPAPDEHRTGIPNVDTNPAEAEAVTNTEAEAVTEAVRLLQPNRTAVRDAWENKIGILPFSLIDEFGRYERFTPEDWFIKAIDITAAEAEQPCWAFCKKVIDGAVSRNQPPGPRQSVVIGSVAEELKRRRR